MPVIFRAAKYLLFCSINSVIHGQRFWLEFDGEDSPAMQVGDNDEQHVHPQCIVVSDGLNCFHGLVQAHCTHKAIITGGCPDSVKRPEFKRVNIMIGNVKNSILGTYHSVREKYVPRYLAEVRW